LNVKTGFGQDSHRFDEADAEKRLLLGGVAFDDAPPLSGHSDADVVLHALTDAVSGVTCVPVIGAIADELCASGVSDSREYLRRALRDLGDWRVTHVSLALECRRPKIDPKADAMRRSIAGLLDLGMSDVALTATSGEGMSEFGRGLGIHASAVVTAVRD